MEWISVIDRLPDDNHEYVLTYGGGGYFTGSFEILCMGEPETFASHGWWNGDEYSSNGPYTPQSEVTHWCRLEEPKDVVQKRKQGVRQ